MPPRSYVTVDELAGRALFYVFVEAEGDPLSAPVTLWLNGCARMPERAPLLNWQRRHACRPPLPGLKRWAP